MSFVWFWKKTPLPKSVTKAARTGNSGNAILDPAQTHKRGGDGGGQRARGGARRCVCADEVRGLTHTRRGTRRQGGGGARRRVGHALHRSNAAELLEIEAERRFWEERIEPENYDLLRLPRPDRVFVGLERCKIVGRNPVDRLAYPVPRPANSGRVARDRKSRI